MLRVSVKTARGTISVYDSGRVLLKASGKRKWRQLVPDEDVFRGVGYKKPLHKRHAKRRVHLRAV